MNWALDAAKGSWSAGPSENSYEAESAAMSGGAKTASCSGCSGGSIVGYVGGSPGGTLKFSNISSSVDATTTIRIHHQNGDKSQRFANVVVNGKAYVTAFLPTSGSDVGTSVLTVPLKAGSGNTIEFQAYNGGWGPDIDRIQVPVS